MAEEPHPFVHTLTLAQENNPDVMIARANLRAAQERLPQSRAVMLPQVALDITPSHGYSRWQGGDTTENTLSTGLSLSHTLYDKTALMAFEQTAPYVAAFQEGLSGAMQDVFLSVVKRVADLLQAQEVVGLADNHLTIMHAHLTATQARFQAGEITHTNVNQAEARLALAQAEKVQADNGLAVANAHFREVVGHRADEMPTLPAFNLPEFRQMPGQGSVASWLAQLEQRPDWRAAQKQREVAKLAIEQARAGYWPTVSWTSNLHHDWQKGTVDINRYALGLRMALPLFTGGMTPSKITEAHANHTAQQARMDKIHRRAQREVEQAYWDLQNSQALTIALARVVSASQSARDGVEREFQAGSRTALDLLDAQHELFSSLTKLAKSRYSLQLARFQLLHAVGRLTLKELVFKGPPDP